MAPALASWIERFLDHLRVERQLSPHTLNNYRLHLQELGPLAQQLGLAQWSELKAPLVRALVVRLHRGGKLSARSIATTSRRVNRWRPETASSWYDHSQRYAGTFTTRIPPRRRHRKCSRNATSG